jgi:hypothetical protein
MAMLDQLEAQQTKTNKTNDHPARNPAPVRPQ